MRPRVALLIAATIPNLIGCSSESPYASMTGKEIYERRCEQCHGPRGMALRGLANSYAGKRGYWTEETLLAYLENPTSYKKRVPHLAGSKKYMPKQLQYVPDEAQSRLATYVLGLMDELEN